MEALPTFKYHTDPLATGSIVESDDECVCCEKSRGYIYQGPTYGEEDLDDSLCPWCIADGSAHAKFDVEFVGDFVSPSDDGYPQMVDLPIEISSEVSHRTPGFSSWQQDRWLVCCGDAAVFLGPAGKAELEGDWSGAIPSIRTDVQMEDDAQWNHYLEHMEKDGSPTAYVFQCLHCKKLIGYSDCN